MFPYSSIANHQSRNHEMPTPPTFQELVLKLQTFWAQRGCVLQQPYDVEVGAGTMAPDMPIMMVQSSASILFQTSKATPRFLP